MVPANGIFFASYNVLKTAHLQRMADEQAAAAAAAAAAGGGCSAPVLTVDQLELPAQYTLLYGACAGFASEAVVYPLEVIRRQMQLQGMAAAAGGTQAAAGAAAKQLAGSAAGAALGPGAAAWARVSVALAAILKTDGARGLYRGFGAGSLQVLPSAAISYWTYETVKQALGAHQPKVQPAGAKA
jgi:hypothetical protein